MKPRMPAKHVKPLEFLHCYRPQYLWQESFSGNKSLSMEETDLPSGREKREAFLKQWIEEELYKMKSLYKRMSYFKGKFMAEECLADANDMLGPEHKYKAPILNSLGVFYRMTKQFPQSEKVFEKSIRIYTKDYGKNHPYTLVARMNRVLLWRQTGKFEKAKAELTELLAEKKRRDGTGRESIETARCRGYLAGTYYALGDYKTAAEMMKATVSTLFRSTGHFYEHVQAQLELLRIHIDGQMFEEATASGIKLVAYHNESSPFKVAAELNRVSPFMKTFVDVLWDLEKKARGKEADWKAEETKKRKKNEMTPEELDKRDLALILARKTFRLEEEAYLLRTVKSEGEEIHEKAKFVMELEKKVFPCRQIVLPTGCHLIYAAEVMGIPSWVMYETKEQLIRHSRSREHQRMLVMREENIFEKMTSMRKIWNRRKAESCHKPT